MKSLHLFTSNITPGGVIYRSDTVNLNPFVGKDFLRNKRKYELTMYLKHEIIGKHFTETSNKVRLRINHVRINRTPPVYHRYPNDSSRYQQMYNRLTQ